MKIIQTIMLAGMLTSCTYAPHNTRIYAPNNTRVNHVSGMERQMLNDFSDDLPYYQKEMKDIANGKFSFN
jgi:hypothetical protein